jgi:hypothetical protein
MKIISVIAMMALLGLALGDTYLHFPPGTISRNREKDENRQNANRCFNSQDNAAGGKGIPLVEATMYEGSILSLEWVNQHGCNGGKSQCEYVIQILCESDTDGELFGQTGKIAADGGFRDTDFATTGENTNQINPNDPTANTQACRYESTAYYLETIGRNRNKNLFTGDSTPQGNDARYTRQNAGGAEYGLEPQEERDYYPYWHPTEFRDVAIFTENATMCDFYQSESQNVKGKGRCTTGGTANNEDDCPGNWETVGEWGIPAPDCLDAMWSRDNHNGGGQTGYTNSYNHTIKHIDVPNRCQWRLRYNVSSTDISWWADSRDDDTTPIEQNPEVTIAPGINLQLAINPAQFSRTFSDRTSIYKIEKAPSGMSKCKNTWNMGIKGRRGNIVETYPNVEYDWAPARLEISRKDCIHMWWSGTDAYDQNNAPEGQGNNRDSSNVVEIAHLGDNLPLAVADMSFPPPRSLAHTEYNSEGDYQGGDSDLDKWRIRAAMGCGDDPNDTQQDNTPYYCDLGILYFKDLGEYFFMSSRNNAFTNRSHKGHIIVRNPLGLLATATILIGAILIVAGLVAAGSAFYAKGHPNSAVARIFQNGGSRGSGILSSSGSRGSHGSRGSKGSKGSGYNRR